VTSPNITPSPDITAYVDLRMFDESDQAIVDAAIAALVLNMPGYIPREGNTEILILESIALEVAEGIVAVNRLPGAVVQAILLLAGVDRDYGAAPIASATFTLGDTNGYTIPAGTRVYLPLDDGTSVAFLVELPGLTVAAGDSSGTVSIIGDVFTASANGMPAGTRMVMADALPFIEAVELATDVADGRDTETDNQWRDRGVARLSRLSDALVVPRHFEAAALERPEVTRALGIDLYDPQTGPDPGDNPGHMTVAVLGENGAPLSTEAKDAIREDLEARAVAVLVVHVIDIALVTVALTASVHIADGFDSATVLDGIEDALKAYVDPMSWAWGAIIRRNEIISLVDRVDGVDYVIDVSIGGAPGDYTLTGVAQLPKAGVVTATADNP
jgi:uncharacterized phage protein gp47/JayE